MTALGIEVVETKVGDRYVLEAMLERDLNLGGEQSGHLIDLDHATTGDGILSAVRLLSIVRSTGATLRELSTVMTRLPQVLTNVRGVDKARLGEADAVWSVVRAEEARLGTGGRVLLRPSGTEPLVRVMAEAETEAGRPARRRPHRRRRPGPPHHLTSSGPAPALARGSCWLRPDLRVRSASPARTVRREGRTFGLGVLGADDPLLRRSRA
jgi:phosphoglucomutase